MPLAAVLEAKLRARLAPAHLEVQNESGMHSVPAGAESHFKVVVVSAAFEGRGAIDRHRMVHAAIADELRAGLHALSIVARTPAEWGRSSGAVPASPPCQGGAPGGSAASPPGKGGAPGGSAATPPGQGGSRA